MRRSTTASISTPSKRFRTAGKTLAKKTYKKRGYIVPAAPGLLRVPRGMAFPMRLRNTMRYAETINIGVTTGYGKWTFSANGLYDPNISGVGHQPLYFDQLMAIYNHYNVVKSKITIAAMHNAVSVLLTCGVDDDTTTHAPDVAIEEGGAKYAVYGITSGTISPSITRYWNQAVTFGQGASMGAQLIGDSSNNPTEQSYFNIGVFDPLGSTTNVYVQVVLEYTTDWSELKTIAAS